MRMLYRAEAFAKWEANPGSSDDYSVVWFTFELRGPALVLESHLKQLSVMEHCMPRPHVMDCWSGSGL